VPWLRHLVARFSPWRSRFEHRSVHVGFVVDKVALGQVFSEYLGFPCQFSFYWLLHSHHHLSSRAGTIGQLVDDMPSGLSLTPPQETKKLISPFYHERGHDPLLPYPSWFTVPNYPNVFHFVITRFDTQQEVPSSDIGWDTNYFVVISQTFQETARIVP
jgi:hypothetical protein